MEIAAAAPSPAASGPPGVADTGRKGTISSDFETFLRMLTAQMENQDPLNPMKSEEFAVQLATFSGVEQQVRTNDLLEALGTGFGVSGLSGLAGWVGMEARAEVPAAFDGAPVSLSFPSSTSDQRVLVVRDESGAVVQRQPLPAGETELDWAGVAPNGAPLGDGLYRFEIEEYLAGELTGTTSVSVYTRVIEARSESGDTWLVTSGGSLVRAEDVTALREPR